MRSNLVWRRGRQGTFPNAELWRKPFGFYWASQRLGFTLRIALGKRYNRRIELYRSGS